MKIMFLVRMLSRGGAERQLSILAAGLQNLGHQVTVVTFYDCHNNSENSYFNLMMTAGVQVISINKSGRYDIVGFISRWLGIIRELKPDLIYSFLELANVLACLAKFIDKKIKVIWGKRFSELELEKYSFSIRLEHKLDKLLSGIPDLIIANSQSGKKFMQSNGYKQSAVVVYNGVNSDVVCIKDERHLLFSDIDITGMFLFGAVGRFDHAKDYETLIQAFKKVSDQNNQVKLLIIGRTSDLRYIQKIMQLISELSLKDIVYILPEMDNISKFYCSIDVFVSSSYTEGFSNVIAEAMAHGLPCVVTDAGDSSFLIGDAGIVVRRRDPMDLANGLLSMLCDQESRDDFKRLARSRIVNNFSIENFVSSSNNYLLNCFNGQDGI